jgi:hypothetical protein
VARFDPPRGDFERVALRGIAPLPDERYRPVFENRQRSGAPIVMNDFQLNLALVLRIVPAD